MKTTESSSINEGLTPVTAPAAEQESPPKKRGFWRRSGKIAAWVILLLLFFSTAGLLFIQLPVFKRIAINQLEAIIEKNTNGKLFVGSVEGNLLEGFVLKNVTLRLKTGSNYDTIPLVHADKIIANYSILRYLSSNEIGISSLVLEHPVIKLVKFAGDTGWNYTLFSKPSTSKPSPFTQIVDLANFNIQHGSIYVRDYNDSSSHRSSFIASDSKGHVNRNEINWSNLQVVGIDMDSRLYLRGSTYQTAKVTRLSFTEKNSGFFVQNLKFSGSLDSSLAKIENAKLTTGHSSIGFSAELASPRVIQTGVIASLQHSHLDLKLDCPVVGTYELKQFFPKPLNFLAGSPGIILDADGEFGNFHITRLALDFKGQGSISIAGDMKNLHQPDSLSMNVNLQSHNLSNATLEGYVPGLHIPDLSRFGNINISSLTYDGEPLNFHTVFDAHSSGAGDVAANVSLDLRNHNFKYNAGLRTDHFNLAAIIHKPDFEGSITAETHLAGTGTNWKTLSSEITLKTGAPSIFGKYHIDTLDLSGAMKSGTISTDRLDAVVDGGPEAHVSRAEVNLLSENIPFEFDGIVKNFRLAEVLKNQPANPARIDVDANVEGRAKNFEDIIGKIHVRLFDLAYQKHSLGDVLADIAIDSSAGGESNLSLRSNMADLTIEHRFHLGDLIHAVPEHIDALVTAIKNRDFPQTISQQTPAVSYCADSMDFDYSLKLKDLRPLVEFLPQTFLLGQGVVSGNVSGCPNGDIDFTMTGDSLAVILRNRVSFDSSLAIEEDTVNRTESLDQSLASGDSIDLGNQPNLKAPRSSGEWQIPDTVRSPISLPQFGQGVPRIQATPASFKLVARNISSDPKQSLGLMNATLIFKADSVVRLGSSLLYHPNFKLEYKNQTLNFDASTDYNNALGVRLKGESHFPNGNLDFELDTMRIAYANPYYRPGLNELRDFIWMNEGTSHILLAQNGLLTIDTLSVIHPMTNSENPTNAGAQRMSFGGTLHGDSVNAWAYFPSFRLEEYDKIIPISPSAKSSGLTKFNGKVRDMRLTLGGTLERPDISADIFADSMVYGFYPNKIKFDSNSVELKYHNEILSGNIVLHSASITTGDTLAKLSELRASIDSIPIAISFKHGPEYSSDSASVLNRQISASINTSNFPLDVATPFIPPFSKLQGTGDIHFAITGTRQNIEYTGKATVHNAAFLLAATNMWYLFDGPLSFENDSLKLQNILIHNVDADDPEGQADVNGSFNFKGFSIANFDLQLNSKRLMVLSNASRQSLGFVYGPVTINTDGGNFRFHNTFSDPEIDGTINIMSANVIFPESSSTSQQTNNDGIIYETLPNDSMIASLRGGTTLSAHETALNSAGGSGAVQTTSINDTLFPNSMKNIYLNDDGTIANSGTTDAPVKANAALAPSFADKLRMDIRVNTEGSATILFPFSGVSGILGAQLTAELKRGGTLTVERGDDLISSAVGEFDLTQNSTFRFYKLFNITGGSITFLNDFTNPQIYITAEYKGPRALDNSTDAKIDLTISGTKERPTISAQNYTQNSGTGQFYPVQESSDQAAVEDAIYFLASGSFKSESPEGAGVVLTEAGKSISTSLAGDMVSNFLGTTGSFALRSASFSNGNVNLAAQYRDIQIKASTQNFETDIPLSDLIPGNIGRNLLIQLQYNQPTTTSNTVTQLPLWLSKFVYTWHP